MKMHSDSQNSHKNRVGMLATCRPGAQKEDSWGKLTTQTSRISKVLVQGETLSQKVTWTAIEGDRGRTCGALSTFRAQQSITLHLLVLCPGPLNPHPHLSVVMGKRNSSDWAFCPLLGSEETCKQHTGSVCPSQLFPCGLVRD